MMDVTFAAAGILHLLGGRSVHGAAVLLVFARQLAQAIIEVLDLIDDISRASAGGGIVTGQQVRPISGVERNATKKPSRYATIEGI